MEYDSILYLHRMILVLLKTMIKNKEFFWLLKIKYFHFHFFNFYNNHSIIQINNLAIKLVLIVFDIAKAAPNPRFIIMAYSLVKLNWKLCRFWIKIIYNNFILKFKNNLACYINLI